MLKKINRVLKLVGFNLVRAKRRKVVKWTGRLVQSTAEVPLSDYMGDAEWQNTGKTHYVGDDCPGGHRDLEQPRVEQPNSDNKIGGPTS